MNEEIGNTLEEYGLSNKEIKVFLYLVENSGTTAYQIAKETKIYKSTCYDVLERLISKGFVSKSKDESKMIYSTRDITEILGIVKSKEELLTSLIPKIKALESKEKTFVKHVDSESAFLGIDTKISELAKTKELSFVYMLGNNPEITTKTSTLLIQRLTNELLKAGIKKDIKCHGLWDARFRNNDFIKSFEKLGENKFIEVPSNATTMIFDNHVVFFFIEDIPNTIEIKNKKISGEMKSYFENLWKIAKK
jgi:sugar-specific transcriptional regulator TrmB